MSPSSPESAISLSLRDAGVVLEQVADHQRSARSRAAAATARSASATDCASGFSTKQCLPARSTRSASARVRRHGRGEHDRVERRGRRAGRRGRPVKRALGNARRRALARRLGGVAAPGQLAARAARRSCARGSGPSSRGPRRRRRIVTPRHPRAAPPRRARPPGRRRRAAGARPAASRSSAASAAAASRSTSTFQPASTVSVHSVGRAQRHARHAGQVGLLLHAAGVGQHRARVLAAAR